MRIPWTPDLTIAHITWSVKFEDQGTQSGVLRVESEADDVVVQTTEVTSKVTVRDDFQITFTGVFSLVSGIVGFFIGLIGFIWKFRDRQKKQEAQIAEKEAKRQRLIMPGD
jgi:hypothetical protein